MKLLIELSLAFRIHQIGTIFEANQQARDSEKWKKDSEKDNVEISFPSDIRIGHSRIDRFPTKNIVAIQIEELVQRLFLGLRILILEFFALETRRFANTPNRKF